MSMTSPDGAAITVTRYSPLLLINAYGPISKVKCAGIVNCL